VAPSGLGVHLGAERKARLDALLEAAGISATEWVRRQIDAALGIEAERRVRKWAPAKGAQRTGTRLQVDLGEEYRQMLDQVLEQLGLQAGEWIRRQIDAAAD